MIQKQVISLSDTEKVSGVRIVKIQDGTVIDHIAAGHALDVLQILGITGKEGSIVTLAMNITSNRIGTKDIVKLENRFLMESEVARIALVAPEATINTIRDSKIEKKNRVALPETITNVIICPNGRCVTNKEREPITPKYEVLNQKPIKVKCKYCWTIIEEEDIISQFTD